MHSSPRPGTSARPSSRLPPGPPAGAVALLRPASLDQPAPAGGAPAKAVCIHSAGHQYLLVESFAVHPPSLLSFESRWWRRRSTTGGASSATSSSRPAVARTAATSRAVGSTQPPLLIGPTTPPRSQPRSPRSSRSLGLRLTPTAHGGGLACGGLTRRGHRPLEHFEPPCFPRIAPSTDTGWGAPIQVEDDEAPDRAAERGDHRWAHAHRQLHPSYT